MEPTTVQTGLGPIPVWSHPGALSSAKPVILAITGAWATPDDMIRLQGVVGPGWDAAVVRLPGNGTPELAETSIAAWSRAVGELLEHVFAGRPVVLMGLSIGALVALGVRSSQVRRVLALEPPLVMNKLWPMIGALQERWLTNPNDRPMISNIFGVTETGLQDRRYFDLFQGATTPVDVVVGDQPLAPRRVTPRYPSFVDAEEREWLAAQPQVTLHVAPGAGHNIHVHAASFLADLLLDVLAKAQSPIDPQLPLRLEIVAFVRQIMDIRTRLPARALASEPDLQVNLISAPVNLPQAHVEQPKILILQRPALVEQAAWRDSMATAIAAGWLVVLEFDDHPQLIAEVTGVPNAEPDWARFRYQHAIQVSTPALAEFFKDYNPEIAIFPNAVFDLRPFPDAERPVRIFYGGVTRGPFAVEVARSLAPTLADFPDVEFIVVGDLAFFEALPTANKQFHDYLAYEDYLALMHCCAISLSPLQDRPLIDTKSDAKFLDASSVGALTIASPAVYAATIRHGVNGLIAREFDDWPKQLSAALSDPAWRQAMARQAWEYVRSERMFAHQVPARKAWYRALWERREALNRAVMDRLPGLEEAVRQRAG